MQMNKAQLKGLIKECIVEVLEEGITQQNAQLAEGMSHRRKRTNRNKSLPPSRSAFNCNPALDAPVGQVATQANVKQAAKMVAGSGVPQDMLTSLLTDTAQTTLVEQNQHESMGSGAPLDAASLLASKIDPLNLPGANNWAAAAGVSDD